VWEVLVTFGKIGAGSCTAVRISVGSSAADGRTGVGSSAAVGRICLNSLCWNCGWNSYCMHGVLQSGFAVSQ